MRFQSQGGITTENPNLTPGSLGKGRKICTELALESHGGSPSLKPPWKAWNQFCLQSSLRRKVRQGFFYFIFKVDLNYVDFTTVFCVLPF